MTYSWQVPTLSTEELSPILENRRQEILLHWNSNHDANDEDTLIEWMSLLQTRDDLIHEVITKENQTRLTSQLKDLYKLLLTVGEFGYCLPDNLQQSLKVLYKDVSLHLQSLDLESYSVSRTSSSGSLKKTSSRIDNSAQQTSLTTEHSSKFTTPLGANITNCSEYVTPCGKEDDKSFAFSTPRYDPVFSFSSRERETKESANYTTVSGVQMGESNEEIYENGSPECTTPVLDANSEFYEVEDQQEPTSPEWLVVQTPQPISGDFKSSESNAAVRRESNTSIDELETLSRHRSGNTNDSTSGIGSVTSLDSLMSKKQDVNPDDDNTIIPDEQQFTKQRLDLPSMGVGEDRYADRFGFGDLGSLGGSDGFLDVTPDTTSDAQPVRTSTPRPARRSMNATTKDRSYRRSKCTKGNPRIKKKLRLEKKSSAASAAGYYQGSVWNAVTGMFNWYRGQTVAGSSQSVVKSSSSVDTSSQSQSSSKSGSLQISID